MCHLVNGLKQPGQYTLEKIKIKFEEYYYKKAHCINYGSHLPI